MKVKFSNADKWQINKSINELTLEGVKCKANKCLLAYWELSSAIPRRSITLHFIVSSVFYVL
jgi:hypothetical protein